MGLKGVVRDIHALHRSLSHLTKVDEVENESARRTLTVSARRFSSSVRDVIDDKLSLSATLMRAGEVGEANRLLVEVERDVREQEAALIEQMNEVKVAHVTRRERITRLRLARMMAVALLGSAVLTASAIGVSLAGMFSDRSRAAEGESPWGSAGVAATAVDDATIKPRPHRTHRIRIGGIRVALTAKQRQMYRELALTGSEATIEQFLLDVLPDSIAREITAVLDATAADAIEVLETPLPVVEKVRKHAKKQADQEQPEAPAPEQPEAPEDTQTDEPPPPNADDDDGNTDGPGDDGLTPMPIGDLQGGG